MPREPRIEYEDAIYHVMARGDRCEPIVHSDEDREILVRTLGEACGRTGWKVYAWVLLDNHYHVSLRTPEPNLVEGMRWFQTAFSRRINTRNRLWGHLFGGRYKAIPIEDHRSAMGRRSSDYLTTLLDYIHLNPVRAGLVDGSERRGVNSQISKNLKDLRGKAIEEAAVHDSADRETKADLHEPGRGLE